MKENRSLLLGHGRKQPLPWRIAAHRSHEVGSIGGRGGGRERLVDKPRGLPVGLQRDTRGGEQHALFVIGVVSHAPASKEPEESWNVSSILVVHLSVLVFQPGFLGYRSNDECEDEQRMGDPKEQRVCGYAHTDKDDDVTHVLRVTGEPVGSRGNKSVLQP